MATTYKYKQNAGSDWRYIEYNITPDFPDGIKAGETVQIDGVLYNNTNATKEIEIRLGSAIGPQLGHKSLSIPRSKRRAFSMSFVMPNLDSELVGGARTKTYKLGFYTNMDTSGTEAWFVADTYAQELTYLRYRLEPEATMHFRRSDANGAQVNDGNYILCQSLELKLNPLAKVTDITRAFLLIDEAGTSIGTSVRLNQSQLSQMLQYGGLVETVPGLVPGTYDLGKDYEITLSITDGYDYLEFQFTLNRAFAIIDYAKAQNGGLAIGMFSNSTDDHPMVEIAPNHELRCYGECKIDARTRKPQGGSNILGVNTYQEGEHLTGGYWIDGETPIYRYIWTGTATGNSNSVLTTIPGTLGTLLGIHGSLRFGANIYNLPHVSRGGDTYNSSLYLVQGDAGMDLHLTAGSAITGSVPVVAIIEYTKA